MKKVDRLIISELFGPWLMGVAMFSTLLLAATSLDKITNLIVGGASPELVAKITLLVVPPTLINTFAMATLLGSLLAFGRLSNDSEIVALRAGGASMYRIMVPVGIFTLVVACVTYILNDTLVPYATKQAESLIQEASKVASNQSKQPTFNVQEENGQVTLTIQALDFSLEKRTLTNVTIIGWDNERKPTFTMFADQLRFNDRKDWRILGASKLISADGRDRTDFKEGVWPGQLPQIAATPEEIVAQKIKNPDYFTSAELRDQISKAKITNSLLPAEIRDREYWLWNKIAIPLAAFVFGVLGATLGIRSHRAGTGAGFALAIVIMFTYQTIARFMNQWAMGGVIPPMAAAFTPLVLGLGIAGLIMWRRNNA